MSTKKKVRKSKQEEAQAKKVIGIIFAALIILGFVLMMVVSYMQ